MLADGQPALDTARLVLRPFTIDDADDVQRMAGAREVADTTLHIPHPYPEGAAALWIGTHDATWRAGDGGTWAIVERERHALVGAIGMSIAQEHLRAEIGYWIGVPHWNRGYCTEAARAVVTYGFDVLGLQRVQAHHLLRNPASGRVMQKLGMQREGVHRDLMRKAGAFEDVVSYAVVRGDAGYPA